MKTKYHITKDGKTVDQYGREYKLSDEALNKRRKKKKPDGYKRTPNPSKYLNLK